MIALTHATSFSQVLESQMHGKRLLEILIIKRHLSLQKKIAIIIELLLGTVCFIFIISVFILGRYIEKIIPMLQNWVLRVRNYYINVNYYFNNSEIGFLLPKKRT